MKFFRLVIVLALVSVGLVAESYYQCYKYSKSDLQLKTERSYEHIYLAMPPKPSSSEMGYLIFTDADKETIRFLQSIACQVDEAKGLYTCGGECDGGGVFLSKNMGLTLDPEYSLVVQKESLNGSDAAALNAPDAISIIQKHKPAQATKTSCPPAVTTIYHPKRDKRSDKPHYVCYKQKIYENKNPEYYGCKISKQLCRTESLHYFGHYPSSSSTKKALKRCQNSTPKRK